MFRGVKADELTKPASSKAETRKGKRQKGLDNSEGIAGDTKEEHNNDSFEKYYNKELDLDEGKLPLNLSFRPSACRNLRINRKRN